MSAERWVALFIAFAAGTAGCAADQIAGTGDFTGTGEDSMLWRNTNGGTELWNPNGSGGFTYQNLGVVNTSWQVAETGDFTGSGAIRNSVAQYESAPLSFGTPTVRAASPTRNLGVVSTRLCGRNFDR